jgi:hypothetical protein
MKVNWSSSHLRLGLAALGAAAFALTVAGCASGGGGRPAVSKQSAAPCPAAASDPNQVVDAERPAQDPQLLQSVAVGMCLSDVLAKLGPAHHFGASGVFVFEWKATDGRTLQVGAPSLRDKAVFVRWAGGKS